MSGWHPVDARTAQPWAAKSARIARPITDGLAAWLPPRLEQGLRMGASAFLPLKHWRIPFTRLTGTPHGGGPEATMLVIGVEGAAGYWIGRFFAAPPRWQPLGSCSLRQLHAEAGRRRDDADLTLVCLDHVSGRWFADDDYLMVPEWIAMRAPVPPNDMVARRDHSAADDLRRVRNGDLTWRLAGEPGALDDFYHRMYLPYVQARHGALAHPHSHARLARAWRHGALLVVERAGEPVAGHLVAREGEVLHLVAMGIKDGDARLMKSGVGAALYVFVFDYARGEGYRWLDLRGTRPSLTDGVLRYKRKWGGGAAVKRDVLHAAWMHWHDLSGPAGAFVARCMPIFRAHGTLCGLAAPAATGSVGTGGLAAARDAVTLPGLGALCFAIEGETGPEVPPGVIVAAAGAGRRCDPRAIHAALRAHRVH